MNCKKIQKLLKIYLRAEQSSCNFNKCDKKMVEENLMEMFKKHFSSVVDANADNSAIKY